MNTKVYEMRINRDLERTKKDLSALRDDAVSTLSKRFEEMTDKPRKTAAVAVKNLNKSIGQGLDQYNSTIQDAVNKVPGSIGKKAVQYPWVTISLAIIIGLILGASIKGGRR